jgi:hypothetical protein
MTDATRERSPEGRAPQSCKGSASKGRSIVRCGRASGTGLCHFAAASVPLPRTGSGPKSAGPATRKQTGIYSQAPTNSDSAGPDVRRIQRIVDQRGGQPSVARAAAARARAWVSRRPLACGPVGWSIDSIVCYRTNWRRLTSYWCRRKDGQPEPEKELWNRQRPSRR